MTKKEIILNVAKRIESNDSGRILSICKGEYPGMCFIKKEVEDVMTQNEIDEKIKSKAKSAGDWFSCLKFDSKGNPAKTLDNLCIFFEKCPLFINDDGTSKFRYNEFTGRDCYDGEPFTDRLISQLRRICEVNLHYCSKDNVIDAALNVSLNHRFNPFKEALEKIMWDGQERAEEFFIKYLGVEDTPLNRAMTMKWLYAMMKRLYEPGCQFDSVLIIHDETQGTGKSKIMERLVGCLGVNYGYTTNINCDLSDKDTIDKLNRSWIVGIDELSSFIRKDPDEAKQFFSQTQDTARLSYNRFTETFLRHCVFYGNTNNQYFLKDYSSEGDERRYWVMNAHGTRRDPAWWKENMSDDYLRQVLAEIKYLYDTDKNFDYLSLNAEQRALLQEVQDGHKTYKQDTNVKYAIFRILDGEYSKREFNSWEEFNNEAELKASNGSENLLTTGKEKIDFIPCEWVKNTIETSNLRRNLSVQYISKIVQGKWDKKVRYYRGKRRYCYVRKGYSDSSTETNELF